MPAVASNTVICVDNETAQGVIKVASQKGRKIACIETIAKTQALIPIDDISSDPNPLAPVRGEINVAGDITMAPNMQMLPFWLSLLTNTAPSGTGVGPYGYSGGMTGGVLRTFMLEKGYTDILVPQYEVYRGLAVKGMSTDLAASGLLKTKFSIVGMDANALSATPYDAVLDDWETGNKLHHGMLGLSINSAPASYVLSGSLNVERNIFTDDRPIGQAGALASLPGGMAKISGTINARFTEAAILTALRSTAGVPLVLTWTYSASPAYHLILTLPEIYFDYTSPKKSKDGLLDFSATFQGAKNTIATNAFSWAVANAFADTEYA
jgi:hypothetical protein